MTALLVVLLLAVVLMSFWMGRESMREDMRPDESEWRQGTWH